MEFAVGQTVFVEDRRYGGTPPEPTPRKIVKLGRKWATLEGWHAQRFAIGPHMPGVAFPLDGGDYVSPGRVWVSLEDRGIHQRRLEAWGVVKRMGHLPHPPDHLPLETLEQIASLLG